MLFISHLASSKPPSMAVTCAQVATSEGSLGNVTLTGRVTALTVKDTGTVITIEGRDGNRVSCWLSKEVPLPNIEQGSKVKVTGTQVQPGLINILSDKDIEVQQNQMAIDAWQVTVIHYIAYFPNGARMPCTLEDGYYPELLLIKVKGGWRLERAE